MELFFVLIGFGLHVANHKKNGLIVIFKRVGNVVQNGISRVNQRKNLFKIPLPVWHGVFYNGYAASLKQRHFGSCGGFFPNVTVKYILCPAVIRNQLIGFILPIVHERKIFFSNDKSRGIAVYGLVVEQHCFSGIHGLELWSDQAVPFRSVYPFVCRAAYQRGSGKPHILLVLMVPAHYRTIAVQICVVPRVLVGQVLKLHLRPPGNIGSLFDYRIRLNIIFAR